MPEEMSCKERLMQLQSWMPEIIETVKKDLKNDHLKQDALFLKKYFPGKNLNKIEDDELQEGYMRSIQEEEKGNEIAEFIIHRWIFKNSELYHFFEEHLSKINPDVTKIMELTEEEASSLAQAACAEFGAVRTFIFSSINGVAFPAQHLKQLEETAKLEKTESKELAVDEAEERSLDVLKTRHAQEIARLTDRYEKKLIGFQKKYTQDVGALKKQLAHLQRKLASV